ncbi:MAG TPA: malto-oligosyltrehalose trehalohydrolase [Opitutaceae bacterium]|nr:malto-oligosyltrehalose trehalohydrolase [Opitutaceae bacterium]
MAENPGTISAGHQCPKPQSMRGMAATITRRLPVGAEVQAGGGVDFRVWAPASRAAAVMFVGGGEFPLGAEAGGYFSGFCRGARAGSDYRIRLDAGLFPDPASRFQPQGVAGPSECIDPGGYAWRHPEWRRPRWRGQSIYELHVGTFTRDGTFVGACARLDHLRELGVEAIELMPVADFPGGRNWGYDGVAWYAPARCYGRPDDLRTLVDAAHGRGLAVILDVVYNHLGPEGNFLAAYSRDYFRGDRPTPWGPGPALDGPVSGPVREYIVANAAYWLDEFRIDGLRLDATHALPDSSPRHLLEEITDAVHAREGFVIAEDERNLADLVREAGGEPGLDAVWADDFHHQARVALTGTRKSYFASYGGTTADLADTLLHGWSYRGQPFPFRGNSPRGSACRHLPASAFVVCLENHDQVGNRAHGERLEHLVTPAQFRAASLLLCLGPYVPLIFMGQEWAATAPFLFFTDHPGEVGLKVSEGRRREFDHGGPALDFPDPQHEATFRRSKLDWAEREAGVHRGILALYREALGLRRAAVEEDFTARDRWRVAAGGGRVALRYQFGGSDWLLVAVLGPENPGAPAPDELLRPPADRTWAVRLDSEDVRFGGPGRAVPDPATFIGPAAVLYEAGKEVHAPR